MSGSYHLGVTDALTGSFAALGTGWKDGLQAYASYVNSKGGIDGHQVDLTVLDDQAVAATGVANTKQLLQTDHVSGMFIFFSDVAVAAQPLLQQTKTPAILDAPLVTQMDPVQAQMFGGTLVISQEPKPEVQFAKTLVHSSDARVAIITGQSVALADYGDTVAQLARASGWKVVTNQQVPADASNASAEASVVASSHPDAIFMALPLPLEVSAVTTFKQQNLSAPIIGYFGGNVAGTVSKLADPHLYLDAPSPYAGGASGAGMTMFLAAAKAAHLNPNALQVLPGFLDGYVVGAALKRCGYPCSATSLEKSLDELGSFDTGGLTYGPWVYSPSDHKGLTTINVVNWNSQAGKTEIAASGLPLG